MTIDQYFEAKNSILDEIDYLRSIARSFHLISPLMEKELQDITTTLSVNLIRIDSYMNHELNNSVKRSEESSMVLLGTVLTLLTKEGK